MRDAHNMGRGRAARKALFGAALSTLLYAGSGPALAAPNYVTQLIPIDREMTALLPSCINYAVTRQAFDPAPNGYGKWRPYGHDYGKLVNAQVAKIDKGYASGSGVQLVGVYCKLSYSRGLASTGDLQPYLGEVMDLFERRMMSLGFTPRLVRDRKGRIAAYWTKDNLALSASILGRIGNGAVEAQVSISAVSPKQRAKLGL